MEKTQRITTHLIDACIEGDRLAQKRLYELLFPYINAIVRRYLFDSNLHSDCIQETFIKVFTTLQSFSEEKGSVQHWAGRIAINTSINQGKKQSRLSEDSLDGWEGHAIIQPKVMDKLTNDDLISHLKQMPQAFFEVLNLHVIDGFDHTEIAAILGISPELSRQRVSRARKWVKASLHAYDAIAVSTVKKNAT